MSPALRIRRRTSAHRIERRHWAARLEQALEAAQNNRPAATASLQQLVIQLDLMRFGHREPHHVAELVDLERDESLRQAPELLERPADTFGVFLAPLDVPRERQEPRMIAAYNLAEHVDGAIVHQIGD